MKFTKYIAIPAVLALVLGFAVSHVSALESDPGSDVGQDNPVVSAPGTDAGQDAPAGVTPATSGNLDQDAPAGNGGTIGGTVNNPPTGNGGGGTTAFGGGSSGSVVTTLAPTTTPAVVFSSTTCPYITSFMRTGGNNLPSEVSKLQVFLNSFEQANIAVTATFDQATESAVKAFQTKYLSDTMGPWGATKVSGAVFVTTLKKINSLACGSSIALTASEQAQIDAYKARLANEQNGENQENSSTTPVIGSTQVGSTVAVSTSTVNAPENSNTAAAVNANASVISRFWNFLKNIF